ncbi:alpha/beta fold hydrolase [Roseovarius aestuariivivens]|uniref:alpha/beta fold hydrolase n=1 Tax=Roseovarius aestuariivivens TaxID=1888910 RepID=UPI001436715C|nr:alpha/beta hydrolase [Roseovarius aestuariivivens]
MKRSIVGFAGLVLAFGFALPVYSQETDVPRYEPLEECFLEMPEDVAFDCGRVVVPEFPDLRSNKTLTLGVIRLRSTSDQPREPIVFGSGGPGGSAFTLLEIGALSDQDGYYAQLLANHDLIFFSQRGTAFSDPFLACFAVNDIADKYLAGDYPGWRELEQDKLDRFKSCYDDFVSAGVDFAAFNSLENAADIDSIRALFGYDKIFYYGESYGTLLGQHLLREYPETLAAVVLDGALTTTYPSWETELDERYERALGYVVDLCAADDACSSAYPDLEDAINEMYERLQAEPYRFSVEGVDFEVDAEQFSLALYDALYDVTQLRFIPQIVNSMRNDTPNDTAPGFFVAPLPAQTETSLAYMMHFAVVCAEDPTSSLDEAFSLDSLRFELVTDYVNLDAGEYVEMCSHMNLPMLPAEKDAPVISDVPVLILNGGFDPVTPDFTAQPIAEALSNAFSVTFKYGDHVQGAIDACAHSIMQQFFANPGTAPKSSCANDPGRFEFALP